MNIKNLKIYRKGFEKLMRDGVITQATFDMYAFRGHSGGVEAPFKSKDDCGTIGCALGWAPFIIEPKAEHYTRSWWLKTETLDFDDYYTDTFTTSSDFEGAAFDNIFEFLFSSEWVVADNTPEGFLGRLDAVISGDFVA